MNNEFEKKVELNPITAFNNNKWISGINEYFDRLKQTQLNYLNNLSKWIKNLEETRNDNKEKLEEYITSVSDMEQDDTIINNYNKSIKDADKKIQSYSENSEKALKRIEEIENNKERFDYIYKSWNSPLSKEDEDFIEKVTKDYTYSFIREVCKVEADEKNNIFSHMYSKAIKDKIGNIENVKERKEKIEEIFSLYDVNSYYYGEKLKEDFSKLINKRLLNGDVSLHPYNNDSPAVIENEAINIVPTFDIKGYEDFYSLRDVITEDDGEIYIIIENDSRIIKLLVLFNKQKNNNNDLYSLFFNVIKGNQSVNKYKIQIETRESKTGIFINFEINNKIPKNKSLNEKIVVGIDLGINTPVCCAINNGNTFLKIGDKSEILRMQTQLKHQIIRCKKHKNKDIEQAEKVLKRKKELWSQKYFNLISNKVIGFALDNNARYINMEKLIQLNKCEDSELVLLNMDFFNILQQMIEMKAKKQGIIVRYVNPLNTSNICSVCGNMDKMQRKGKLFICNNSSCKNYAKELNADLNAAKNISNQRPLDPHFFSKYLKRVAEKLPTENNFQ